MPQHRRSEILPERLREKIKGGDYCEYFGNLYFIDGGGLRGPRCGLLKPKLPDGSKPKLGTPIDIQYALKDDIITRTEFLRGGPAIPVHMAHFDPKTGKKFSTLIDRY